MLLGIGKKIERARTALHDAFVKRANELVQERPQEWKARAAVLLDLADIIRRLSIGERDLES